MRDNRAAKIALHQSGQIKPVLNEDRPVETVILAELRMPHRIDAPLARHGLDRIAGNEANEHKDKQRDSEKCRNRQTDAV